MQAEETIQRELTAADYWAMVRQHWVLILLSTLIGPPVGYGISRVMPPRYISQTMVLVQPPTVPNSIVPSMDTTTMNQQLASLKQQILSRASLEPVIRQFNLYSADINKKPMDQLVERLQDAIEVTPVAPLAETGPKDLPGFSVSVTLDDPHKAQDVCTRLTSMFIQASNGDTIARSQQVTRFLTEQLAEAKRSLDEQDAKLAAFKSRYLGSLPDDEQANLNLLGGLNTQLQAVSETVARAQQDKTFSESLLQQQLAQTQPTRTGQNPDTLEQQLATLKTQLATQEQMYTDSYPDVIKTKADIAALEKRIDQSANSTATKLGSGLSNPVVESPQIAQLRAEIHTDDQQIMQRTREQEQLRDQIKLYEGRIQQSPEVEQRYTELTRGRETANESYNALLKEQHDAQMSGELNQQQQGEYFNVLDAANLPSKPSFPNRIMFTAGGLVGGIGLGLGLSFFFELRDTSIKSERDVEYSLRLPVLAMIPAVEPVTTKKLKILPALQSPNS
ncbi:MAG TPA: Wzz/FepE/Etk N-terminal domain-containing protein, partial [Terriglobales bacterium]|nr:Wzz/FepE/Etk N-terminal domain-containing protein [Terriglobales bacterium]